jgi:hypothetical protein
MLSGVKPLTITKRQAKELLPPKLVDRLIYAAKNFPKIGGPSVSVWCGF